MVGTSVRVPIFKAYIHSNLIIDYVHPVYCVLPISSLQAYYAGRSMYGDLLKFVITRLLVFSDDFQNLSSKIVIILSQFFWRMIRREEKRPINFGILSFKELECNSTKCDLDYSLIRF